MATWGDVKRIALGLPGAEERHPGVLDFVIKGKGFAWERPLRRGDIEALGDDAPDGDVLAARVPDVGAKEALIADDPEVYFTTPHFEGYPAILVRLAKISEPELVELLTEAWLTRAPKRLAAEFLTELEARLNAEPKPPAPKKPPATKTATARKTTPAKKVADPKPAAPKRAVAPTTAAKKTTTPETTATKKVAAAKPAAPGAKTAAQGAKTSRRPG